MITLYNLYLLIFNAQVIEFKFQMVLLYIYVGPHFWYRGSGYFGPPFYHLLGGFGWQMCGGQWDGKRHFLEETSSCHTPVGFSSRQRDCLLVKKVGELEEGWVRIKTRGGYRRFMGRAVTEHGELDKTEKKSLKTIREL